MLLGIIIVEYRSSDETIRFVSQELTKIKIPYRLVIVSNGAIEKQVDKLVKDLDAVLIEDNGGQIPVLNAGKESRKYVIATPENLGFARGNNLGAKFLIENFNCDYLLFSNNDIQITSSEVVPALIEKLKEDKHIGLIGPEVVGLDGKRQSPEPFIQMSDRFVWMYLATPFMSLEKKRRRFKLDYAENAQEGYHFRVMGSFFIMPTAAYIEADGFDSATFLYAEEMIMAKRLEIVGYGVYFFPTVRVVHAHGVTTSKYIRKFRTKRIQCKSERYYYETYCGVPKWRSRIYYLINNIYLRIKYCH